MRGLTIAALIGLMRLGTISIGLVVYVCVYMYACMKSNRVLPCRNRRHVWKPLSARGHADGRILLLRRCLTRG